VSALERARECFNRITGDDAVDDRVDVIASLGAVINHLEAASEFSARPPTVAERVMADPTMSRADALKLAREHVEAMSTNGRGYQDGVKMHDKVQAMERFARFLMGESE
jgi:hypothetical protein